MACEKAPYAPNILLVPNMAFTKVFRLEDASALEYARGNQSSICTLQRLIKRALAADMI
jgi:hypothetical protein